MNKKTLIIIVCGLLLIILGIILMKPKTKKEEQKKPQGLTQNEAVEILKEYSNKVIDVYENPDKLFETEPTEEGKILIKNYDEIIKTIFTKNGIEEIEKLKFNKKNFVEKDKEGKVFFLNELPSTSTYKDSKLTVYSIKYDNNKIEGTIKLYDNKLEDDAMNYYTVYKEVKLVKTNDNWYVDSFNYGTE